MSSKMSSQMSSKMSSRTSFEAKEKLIRKMTELCSEGNIKGIEKATRLVNSPKNRKFWKKLSPYTDERDKGMEELLRKLNEETESLLSDKKILDNHPFREEVIKSRELLNVGFLSWASGCETSSDED